MRSSVRRALLVVLVGCASVALAVTVEEIEQRANALHAEYQELGERIEGCPDGTCPSAMSIVADFDAAELDRATLHADRNTLNPCSTCHGADYTLSQIDSEAVTLGAVIVSWDDGS